MKIALISYNAFVEGVENGWKENGDAHVLLIQNRDGKRLGVNQNTHDKGRKPGEDECRSQVADLFTDLAEAIPTLNKVFIYVGSYGAELVVELAGKHGLAPDRAVFVMCDCNTEVKKEMIRRHGFGSSEVVKCGCGGWEKMRELYYKALGLCCAQPKCPFRTVSAGDAREISCTRPACPFRG